MCMMLGIFRAAKTPAMALSGQIAIVTGASRGIGRGVALQLGEAGATVYVTGRQPKDSDSTKFTSAHLPQLEKTANEISERGGRGIPVYVDHSNMDEVKAFFERVKNENNGQLDILVNNAYSAVHTISTNMGKKFFECPPEMWDDINNVGLRNHYFCSVYAARLMDQQKKGLIVNISSAGGLQYLFNVPYGVGKQALDRLSADMAVELKRSNVCVVSIWPGAVRTEMVDMYYGPGSKAPKDPQLAEMFATGESTEYPGKAVVALAADPKKMDKSGRILITADLGAHYGFLDIDGREPSNMRNVNTILRHFGYKSTAGWIPNWVKLPGWAIWTGTSRL